MNEGTGKVNPAVLKVNEIFYSIQGESTFAGRPCVFVRLTYCNLRCSYCDTAYAFYEGTDLTLDEIIAKVRGYNCSLVEITGGEPLVQSESLTLMRMLCDDGFEVLLETGGSLDVGSVDGRVHRIVDFKSPSSGMVGRNLWENVRHLRATDEAKFVIGDREDYKWAKEVVVTRGLHGRCPVLFSPVFDKLEPSVLAGWILNDKLDVRMQLQLHKYLWHPELRGV